MSIREMSTPSSTLTVIRVVVVRMWDSHTKNKTQDNYKANQNRGGTHMRKKQKIAGYREINTPEILDRSLWEKSGHWEKFGEHMYTSTTPDEKIFAIKPMNVLDV